MRFAIFGDIHANLEALQTVLTDAREQGCADYVCLGDVVGYNANPKECLSLVRSLKCPVVKGNHDEYSASDSDLDSLNPLAELAIQWTREQLTVEEKQWLSALPYICEVHGFTIVHATLFDPPSWDYVLNQLNAAASFSQQKTEICFHGHTHVPRAYLHESSVIGMPYEELSLVPGPQYFINVGSVGQPRDGDWRAAYVIFDTETRTVCLRRLPYDLPTTQKKILACGLPPRLADRLALGR